MVAVIAASHSLGRGLIDKIYQQFPVRAIGRSQSKLKVLFPAEVQIYQADFTRPEELFNALDGCEIVVNIAHAGFVPLILENLPSSVKKIVAVGSTWKFTKFPNERAELVKLAEEQLSKSNLDWVMLHPSMIYGMQEEKTISRLIQWIRKFPVVPLPIGGNTLVQPVYALDIVDALVAAVKLPQMTGQSYILAAHNALTYKEMVKICGQCLHKRVLILSLPKWFLKFIIRILNFTPWKSKFRTDQIDRLTEDKKFDVSPIEGVLQRNLKSFSTRLISEEIGHRYP